VNLVLAEVPSAGGPTTSWPGHVNRCLAARATSIPSAYPNQIAGSCYHRPPVVERREPTSRVPVHGVLHRYDACLWINALTRQRKSNLLSGTGHKRYSVAQEYRDETYFNGVHYVGLKQAPEEGSTAKEPDVCTGLLTEFTDDLAGILGHNRHVRMVFRPQRPRKDKDLLPRNCGSAATNHGFIRQPSDQKAVKLSEEFAEIDIWILHDPIGFALGTGYETVQACCDRVSNSAHRYHHSFSTGGPNGRNPHNPICARPPTQMGALGLGWRSAWT